MTAKISDFRPLVSCSLYKDWATSIAGFGLPRCSHGETSATFDTLRNGASVDVMWSDGSITRETIIMKETIEEQPGMDDCMKKIVQRVFVQLSTHGSALLNLAEQDVLVRFAPQSE